MLSFDFISLHSLLSHVSAASESIIESLTTGIFAGIGVSVSIIVVLVLVCLIRARSSSANRRKRRQNESGASELQFPLKTGKGLSVCLSSPSLPLFFFFSLLLRSIPSPHESQIHSFPLTHVTFSFLFSPSPTAAGTTLTHTLTRPNANGHIRTQVHPVRRK